MSVTFIAYEVRDERQQPLSKRRGGRGARGGPRHRRSGSRTPRRRPPSRRPSRCGGRRAGVLEVRVVDDRDRAGRLRERGLDCGALAAVAIVLEEDPLDLPAPSAAALERVGRRRARARRRGKRGRERDPALGGEQPEHLGGSRPGGPAVQLDGIDVGPSTARVFGPSGARAELPRTPLFTGKLSAPSAR
jgi:hypothetical protein